jgi:hypothetical protein
MLARSPDLANFYPFAFLVAINLAYFRRAGRIPSVLSA